MLEKHLGHLKKPGHGMDAMVPPPGQAPLQPLAHTSARQSMKDEDSPAKSPATVSNWNSPSNVTGVSPAASSVPDEYMNVVHHNHSAYGMQAGMPPANMVYNTSPHGPMGAPRQPPPPHRRQISDISGGVDDMSRDVKRQQMYGPPPQQHPMQKQPMGQPMGQSMGQPM
ncbi:kinase-regulated stress-responsive transcription factor skn7, partial [Cryomyces antarcticus]